MSELLDARGVEISPGDVAIYGFGVGRSVAMAEAVVLWEGDGGGTPARVSLTPSGRVRLRVVRRSYGDGQKPVVDVAPDRLVVLKGQGFWHEGYDRVDFVLPPSPLPTQAEENRKRIENLIEMHKADLRATEVPDRHYYERWDLAQFHAYAARRLDELRQELARSNDAE